MDIEQTQVIFHERANTILFNRYRKFESDAQTIDRRKNEYFFQQLKEKHVHSFKAQMDGVAKNIIRDEQYNKQLSDIDRQLNHLIKDYLHLFVQKINAF